MTNKEISDFLKALPMPVAIIGPRHLIVAANPAALSLLGAHIVGRHFITALRQPALMDSIESAYQSGTPQQTRYLGRDADRDVTYDVYVKPKGDDLVVTFLDSSATEQAEQMRRDFVANVSHELRTPLTALLGFIETLRGNARDDAKARGRFLDIMEREAQRMTHIVADLLSLSRVEAGQRIRPHELVSLSGLISATIAELEPVITAAHCDLRFFDESDGQKVPADEAQLRQVLVNLIENALKYGANEKRVLVHVFAPKHEPSLRQKGIRLEVQDWGDGIEEHHISRLTERFYRVDSHRSRSVGGTGLGLAIVKHIVNRHRGRLQIESTVGKGTKVSVILPVKQ